MKVLDFPLTKIALFFIIGLWISKFFPSSFIFSFSAIAILLIALLISYFYSLKNSKLNYLFGYITIVFSFILGFFINTIHYEPNNKNHYLHTINQDKTSNYFEIELKERLKSTLNNDRYVARILKINNEASFGKIIVNINRKHDENSFEIGSKLTTSGYLYLNRKPNNPNQFDYGKYLENQQIYGQLYTETQFIKNSGIINKGLHYYGSKIRNRIINNLNKAGFAKNELSVVIALILGQQQDISKEIIKDYQYAGAVHILSVSGLHVGFILLFITSILKFFPNSRKWLIIKLVITIIALWGFGVLAGLAPSVVRSVTMFSFVALGIYLKRSVNIYHTLLVSMLLILLVQPSFLFDIGFQLSYLALFFILWFQPLLTTIWKPKTKISSYFWDIITVSFAAQIGTLPLSIYYFHQFPVLFLVTNLLILPLMSIILGLALLLSIFAAFDVVPYYLMKITEFSIVILNKIISWVATFKSFVLTDIPFNTYLLFISYLLIISAIIWFEKPSFNKLKIVCFSVIAFQIAYLFTVYSSSNSDEFIVFNRKGYTLITEKINQDVAVFSNDSILKTIDDNLVVKSYLAANFSEIQNLEPLKNFHYFKNKKIAIIDSSGLYFSEIKPDVLLLIGSPKINLSRLIKTHKPKKIVCDASNFSSYRKLWKSTCLKEKILFHDTTEKGFYKL
jgi:competence protein ComEC